MTSSICKLIPMARCADVERSVRFYEYFGFEVVDRVHTEEGTLNWASLRSRDAEIMFSLAGEPVEPLKQGVLFYLYSVDLVALRIHLIAAGVDVSEITYPFYMTKGEMCVTDPDGYCLLIGQAG